MSQRIETFSIFTAHILSELYDAFPIPSILDQRKAVSVISSFEIHRLDQLKSKLSMKRTYYEIIEGLLASDNPHLDADQRKKFEDMLSNTTTNNTQEEINKLEILKQEIDNIYKGTITFLEAEKYIRKIDSDWQLTEKGFGQLNKKFSGSDVIDTQGTLMSRIKEQLTNPTNIGTLVKLTSSVFF